MVERRKMDAPFREPVSNRKRELGFRCAARNDAEGPTIGNCLQVVTIVAESLDEIASSSFPQRVSRRAGGLSDRQRLRLFGWKMPNLAESQFLVTALQSSICFVDISDQSLWLTPGCWNFACQRDSVSEHQASVFPAILTRLCKAWAKGILICQNTSTLDATDREAEAAPPPAMRKH